MICLALITVPSISYAHPPRHPFSYHHSEDRLVRVWSAGGKENFETTKTCFDDDKDDKDGSISNCGSPDGTNVGGDDGKDGNDGKDDG